MEKKNSRKKCVQRLAAWTFGWVLTVALVAFGAEFLWNGNKLITGLALALNLGVGIGMVLANRRLMEDLDELERKVQLEAMALTLGLTLIVGIAYSLMDTSNLIPWDAEIAFLVMFMGIFYIVALVTNTKRYL